MTVLIKPSVRWQSLLGMGVAAVLLGTLAACGSKLTQDNIDKVDSGMSRSAVHSTLGKPNEVTSDDIGGLMKLTKDVWKGPPGTVTVTYNNDVVILKAQEPNESAAGH